MKHATFTIVVIVILSLMFHPLAIAQEDGFLLDSVRETTTMGYGTYTIRKSYYYYNDFNQLKFINKFTNKNSFPDTADWYCTGKEYEYYDDSHRLTEHLTENKYTFETDWSEKHKWEYGYNDTTYIQTSSFWDFDSGVWLYGQRIIDTLKPPEAKETSRLFQEWYDESGDWENEYWNDTIFLQDFSVDSVLRIDWPYGYPENTDTVIRKYDYSNSDTTYVHEHGPWGLYLDKIYFADDSLTGGDTTLKCDDFFDIDENNDTTPLMRYRYYYDGENRLIRYAKYMKFTEGWYPESILKYTYDEDGFLIKFEDCCYNAVTYYYYNDDGLMWKKIYNHGMPISTFYYFYSYTYVSTPKNLSSSANKILFYPNPAQNEIRFNGLQNLQKQYQIFDVTGRPVKQGYIPKSSNSINISNLIPGNYFTVITSNNITYRGKFIKY